MQKVGGCRGCGDGWVRGVRGVGCWGVGRSSGWLIACAGVRDRGREGWRLVGWRGGRCWFLPWLLLGSGWCAGGCLVGRGAAAVKAFTPGRPLGCQPSAPCVLLVPSPSVCVTWRPPGRSALGLLPLLRAGRLVRPARLAGHAALLREAVVGQHPDGGVPRPQRLEAVRVLVLLDGPLLPPVVAGAAPPVGRRRARGEGDMCHVEGACLLGA